MPSHNVTQKEMNSHRFFVISSWCVGGFCIILPHLWWPTPININPGIHLIVFFSILGILIQEKREGGLLDTKRAEWRGYLGVIAFAALIFGSVIAYRAFIMPKNVSNKVLHPTTMPANVRADPRTAPLISGAHLRRSVEKTRNSTQLRAV